MSKLEKILKDIEKTKKKIHDAQRILKELEQQKTHEEDLQIVRKIGRASCRERV